MRLLYGGSEGGDMETELEEEEMEEAVGHSVLYGCRVFKLQ